MQGRCRRPPLPAKRAQDQRQRGACSGREGEARKSPTRTIASGGGCCVKGLDRRRARARHIRAVAALGVDVYMAGLVHRPDEIVEQNARGKRIADACRAYVAFASFAGPTGGGYDATAGQSTIWSSDGTVIARASDAPGDIARAELSTTRACCGRPGALQKEPVRRILRRSQAGSRATERCRRGAARSRGLWRGQRDGVVQGEDA